MKKDLVGIAVFLAALVFGSATAGLKQTKAAPSVGGSANRFVLKERTVTRVPERSVMNLSHAG